MVFFHIPRVCYNPPIPNDITMKIILLKDVPKVGRKFDVKDIADGYALNFVIPKGWGVRATPAELAKIEKMKATQEADKQIQLSLLRKDFDALAQSPITIKAKVNDKGHLFAGVGVHDIVSAVQKEKNISLEHTTVRLESPLRQVGEFSIPLESHGIKGKMMVVVEAI